MGLSALLLHTCLFLQFEISLIHAQTPTEPCAAVSSVVAAQATDTAVTLPAEVAYQCLESVPLVEKDATELLDAWAVFLQFQSDPTYKAKPPSGYLYPGIDYFQAIAVLREQVTSGNITRELDFQNGIQDIWWATNDGHLTFSTDFNSAFSWSRQYSIVAISPDGQSIPEVYTLSEVELASQGNLAYRPSNIVAIDGQPVTDFLTASYNKADHLQDPDAMYNANLYLVADSSTVGGGFFAPERYPGPSTTLTFANGSTQSYPNTAGANVNFTGIIDGPSFYFQVCNATQKIVTATQANSGSLKSNLSKRGSTIRQVVERQSSGLEPVVSTDDLSFQGYFLSGSEELNRTAVITLSEFSFDNVTQTQKLLRQFLHGCRDGGYDRLVLDLSSNGGGNIAVAYDFMKQLFPTIEPYFQRDFRAQPQIEILGEYFTNVTSAILVATDGNRTATLGPPDGGNPWDTTYDLDRSGRHFSSWTSFYGPFPDYGDSRTSIFTWDISDTVYMAGLAENGEPYAITGFDFNAPAPPQPFAPENIIILSDGRCSSSCTTLSHFLKWQAKVKSIVIGGRPGFGPMQQQGGIKGGTVASHSAIVFAANELIHDSGLEGLVKRANATDLKALIEQSDYIQYRSSDPTNDQTLRINVVNSVLANEVANGNDTLYAGRETTPLQYIYEAADCRLFFTGRTALSRYQQWGLAAYQAFGFNGTEVFSGCVEGSTNHPTSLSGDAKLFNGGKPVNVTGFNPPNTGAGPVDTSAFDLTGNRLVQYVDDYLANMTGSANGSGTASQSSGTAASTPSPSSIAGGWTRFVAVKSGLIGSIVAVVVALLAMV